MGQHVHGITHVILIHKSTVMLFQTCMSSANPKLLLLGTAPGLLAKLGDTSATASLANRLVTNISRC